MLSRILAATYVLQICLDFIFGDLSGQGGISVILVSTYTTNALRKIWAVGEHLVVLVSICEHVGILATRPTSS